MTAKAERKRGRRRGLKVIGSGVALTLLGGVMMAFSSAVTAGRGLVIPIEVLGAGILALVLGLAMLVSGASDE